MLRPTHETDAVCLTIPADVTYAQLARMTAATVAARFDFTYDDVEDVRIAVGELCGVLLGDDPDGRIEIILRFEDEVLEVEAWRLPAGGPVELGSLSQQILDAVTDEVTVHEEGTGITIRKQRRS